MPPSTSHLGIREFLYMGYCIGGCFAGKLLERAPERVIAAVFCQSVGHRPEDRDVMYRHGHEHRELLQRLALDAGHDAGNTWRTHKRKGRVPADLSRKGTGSRGFTRVKAETRG